MSKTEGWCLVRVGLLHLSTVEDVTGQHTWKIRWGMPGNEQRKRAFYDIIMTPSTYIPIINGVRALII